MRLIWKQLAAQRHRANLETPDLPTFLTRLSWQINGMFDFEMVDELEKRGLHRMEGKVV